MRANKIKETLRQEKEAVAQLEAQAKEQKAEYDLAMKELRKTDGEFRRLRDKNIQSKVVVKTSDEDLEKEQQTNSVIQKNKVLTKIADNKVKQISMQINAQKKNNEELDKEIEEVKKTIKDKLELNDKLSKRGKELKGMIVEQKQGMGNSGFKQPTSPTDVPESGRKERNYK